VSNIKTLLT